MNLGTWLYTRLYGEAVGTDEFGNRYFRAPSRIQGRHERRWVIYKGEPDPTTVPPEWHAWLHFSVIDPPPPGGPRRRAWERETEPNATGTPEAYRPPGHVLSGGRRARATGDYEPWTPH